MAQGTDLATGHSAPVRALAITPVSTTAQAVARYEGLQEFVKKVMVRGEDYGRIPGTSKDTLYKPGAEKLAEMYGLAITLPDERRRAVENWVDGFWHYEVTAVIISRETGQVVAEGIGSCNSLEEKYRWRKEWWNGKGEPDPAEHWERIWIKGKDGRAGRAAYFKNHPNEARWDLPNTLLKMAKKRAVVDGVLSTTRSSGLFTQDMEDRSPLARGSAVSVLDEAIDAEYIEVTAQPGSEPPPPPAPPLELGEITRLEDAVRAAETPEQLKAAHGALAAVWERIPRELHDRINATVRTGRIRIENIAKRQATGADLQKAKQGMETAPTAVGDVHADRDDPPETDEPVEQGGRPGIDPALPGLEPAPATVEADMPF